MKESAFQFLGFRFTKLTFEIADQFPTPNEIISNNIAINRAIDEKDRRLVKVSVDIHSSNELKTLNIALQIQGSFKATEDTDEADFQHFCEQNAPAILFPYARAFVSSMTALAGIPPLVLPTLNFITAPPPDASEPASAAEARPN